MNNSKEAQMSRWQKIIEAAKRKQISPAQEKKEENKKRAKRGEATCADICRANDGNEDTQEDGNGDWEIQERRRRKRKETENIGIIRVNSIRKVKGRIEGEITSRRNKPKAIIVKVEETVQ